MSESHRLSRDVLKLVHNDIINGKLFKLQGVGVEEEREYFIDHYLEAVKFKTHPTHYMVSYHEDFHHGGNYSFEGRVPKNFIDDWLDVKEPIIGLGDVNGKYSKVERPWCRFGWTDD